MIFSFDGVPETRQAVNTPRLRISSASRVETPRQRSSGNGPSSNGGHGGNIVSTANDRDQIYNGSRLQPGMNLTHNVSQDCLKLA